MSHVPHRPVRIDLERLARAAGELARAPAGEREWRLRRMIGECAALAASEGVDALDLAHDAWHAAIRAAEPATPTVRVRPAAPASGAVVVPFARTGRG